MVGYEIKLNNIPEKTVEYIDAHRLIPEFKRFKEIIEQRDIKSAAAMMDISIAVLKVIEMARQQQDIEVGNV